MSSGHGKDSIWTINAIDISAYVKTDTWERNPDIHDITGKGKQNKVKRGGLLDGKFTAGGWYDTGAAGPRGTLEPLEGTTCTLIHKPEGTGTGKPQRSVSVVVGKYDETSPVDDIVSWTQDFEMSDAVTRTTQS